MKHRFLMSGLLEGWDWFDNALQNVLRDKGFGSFTKSQSMMILYVSAGVNRPSEVARRMRLSRQAIRHVQQQLEEQRIIRVERNPDDARAKRLVLNEESAELSQTAREVIFALESVLTRRIGEANLAALRTVLDMDWGAAISGLDELDVSSAGDRDGDTTSSRQRDKE